VRQIGSHRVNECNRQIEVAAIDESRCHYFIGGFETRRNPSADSSCNDQAGVHLVFQNGEIAGGVNGLTNEALLAVILDRLEGFQAGELRCRENALAITKIEEAVHWLRHRTDGRERRGVEGTRRP